jgi:galactose-1-phosphate uridylyltransferase
MDIQVLIRKLVSYGVQTGLVPEEDAGVYKRTEEGQKAFDRFVKSL